jgi:hypothetical protein
MKCGKFVRDGMIDLESLSTRLEARMMAMVVDGARDCDDGCGACGSFVEDRMPSCFHTWMFSHAIPRFVASPSAFTFSSARTLFR